jgi:hypothetical protein
MASAVLMKGNRRWLPWRTHAFSAETMVYRATTLRFVEAEAILSVRGALKKLTIRTYKWLV